jgi:Fe-S cluster biosynthesis and repair protein YggX
MSEIHCHRCGQNKPGLAEAPLPGQWGAAVLAETCSDCWRDWTEEQTRLMNHLGLQPFKAADKKVIYRHLHEYLKLESVSAPEGAAQ